MKMVQIHVVFAKAGGFMNVLARLWTRSDYIHAELLFADGTTVTTSSTLGGVCIVKGKEYSRDHWTFVSLDITKHQERLMREFCEHQNGVAYDRMGFWCFPCGISDSARWTCSALISASMKYAGIFKDIEPRSIDPRTLKNMLETRGGMVDFHPRKYEKFKEQKFKMPRFKRGRAHKF